MISAFVAGTELSGTDDAGVELELDKVGGGGHVDLVEKLRVVAWLAVVGQVFMEQSRVLFSMLEEEVLDGLLGPYSPFHQTFPPTPSIAVLQQW